MTDKSFWLEGGHTVIAPYGELPIKTLFRVLCYNFFNYSKAFIMQKKAKKGRKMDLATFQLGMTIARVGYIINFSRTHPRRVLR